MKRGTQVLGRQVPWLFFDADDAAEFYRLVRAQGAEVLASESPTSRVKVGSPRRGRCS